MTGLDQRMVGGTFSIVSIAVFYLLCCSCRLSMPGIDMRPKLSLFLLRVACASAGLIAAFGFLWMCMHLYIVKNPDTARIYMFGLFGLGVAVGEGLTRRRLRAMPEFRKKKFVPLTF